MASTQYKPLLATFLLSASLFLMQGCAEMEKVLETVNDKVSGGESTSSSTKQCSSNKATIAIADFENKTGTYSRRGNAGLATKLGQKLFKTGCFQVVDRARLKQIMGEINFGQSGLAQGNTASRLGRQIGADLLVFGDITQFDHNRKPNAFFKETARIEVNITMTGVENGVVLVSETIVGKGNIINFVGGTGGELLATDPQSAQNKAVDDMIKKAAPKLVAGIPAKYKGRSVKKVKKKDPNAVLAQQVMKETGFYNGGIDGDWGPMSRKAMKAFQQQFDLPATGELDDQTMQQIRDLKN